jgi:hypothetical protein
LIPLIKKQFCLALISLSAALLSLSVGKISAKRTTLGDKKTSKKKMQKYNE